VALGNTGEVPWKGRLLSRIGVTVSTVMPMTPRVISVPDTEPGGSCSVIITGRPAHLVGVTDIHFIMTFADLRPCFPGDRRTICLTLATTTTIGATSASAGGAGRDRAARLGSLAALSLRIETGKAAGHAARRRLGQPSLKTLPLCLTAW
jgi:hypothetical protein